MQAVAGSAPARKAKATAEPLYPKLKPGPGRSRQKVAEHQRARLHGAMVELAATDGYEHVTVRALARLAGVSTGTFYSHFQNVEDCLASTFEFLMQRLLRRARAARQGAGDGDDGIHAALTSLFQDLAGNPKEAQLILVEAHAAGPEMYARIDSSASALARTLVHRRLAPYLSDGIAAGVTKVARARCLGRARLDLREVAEELTAWIGQITELGPQVASTERRNANTSRIPPSTSGEQSSAIEILRAGDDERSRIAAAVLKISLTQGYPHLTVARICREAGVSRRTFSNTFKTVAESFLYSTERVATATAHRVALHAANTPDPADRLERATAVLSRQIAADPALARLCLIDIRTTGRLGLERTDWWAALLATRFFGSTLPDHEASAALALSVIRSSVSAGQGGDLTRIAATLRPSVFPPPSPGFR